MPKGEARWPSQHGRKLSGVTVADPLNVPAPTDAACPRKDVPPKSITHDKHQILHFIRHTPRKSLTAESPYGHGK